MKLWDKKLTQKQVIVDFDNPVGNNNLCFGPEGEFAGFGLSLWMRLANEAKKRGIAISTADVFLSQTTPQSGPIACLTVMYTPYTNRLIAQGVKPAVCMSLESPLVAQKFYHHMKRYSGRFRHNYQFDGTIQRLRGTGTIFHSMYFPIETRTGLPIQSWNKRDYIVVINSNKRAISQKFSTPVKALKSLARRSRFQFWKLFDPWMQIREVYVDRVHAIHYFADHPGFRLYGHGWNDHILGFGRDYHRHILKAYAGPLDWPNSTSKSSCRSMSTNPRDILSSYVMQTRSKREVMGGFKFALCFENCIFPGYVTEKIFDCFLAGCIPIYWGAPDITEFVPAGTFIDFRRFPSFSELDLCLQNLSEGEAWDYLEAGRDFLASKAFDKFYVDTLVQEIMDIMEQELHSV